MNSNINKSEAKKQIFLMKTENNLKFKYIKIKKAHI